MNTRAEYRLEGSAEWCTVIGAPGLSFAELAAMLARRWPAVEVREPADLAVLEGAE